MGELSPPPVCTCVHPVDCLHACHGRHCDPAENACAIEYLPDDGGLAPWGCDDCTPGRALPHLAACPAAGLPTMALGGADTRRHATA